MNKALKGVLLTLMVFSVVWLATLWRWQTQEVDVGQTEILTHLLVLPAVLLLTLWLGMKIATQVRRSASAPAALPAQVAARPLEGTPAGMTDEAVRHFQMALVDSEVSLLAGDQATQVATAVLQRSVCPQLDEHLQDLDGNPVFTARMPDLELVLDDRQAPLPDGLPERTERARQLLTKVWRGLATRVLDTAEHAAWQALKPTRLADARTPIDQAPNHLAGVAQPRVDLGAAPAPQMLVGVLVPAVWTESQQQWWLGVAQDVWRELAQSWGEGLPWRMSWRLWPLQTPEALWSEVDRLALSWARQGAPQSLVVLAADSAVDEAAIEQRLGRGELFTALHQQGRVPGEGAAAVWLASPTWPGLATQELTALALSRPVWAERDKSADAHGRIGSQRLQQCLSEAMARSASSSLPTSEPVPQPTWVVVSDADHRPSRTSELYESLTEVVPELDPSTSVYRLGDACGDLGLASALSPVAVAHGLLRQQLEQAEEGVSPQALAVHVQSPLTRVVVALKRWPFHEAVNQEAVKRVG